MNYVDLIEEADRRVGADDFVSRADDAIRRAWDMLNRRLRIESMLNTASILADANGTFVKPDDLVEPLFMFTDQRDNAAVGGLDAESAGEKIEFVPAIEYLESRYNRYRFTIVGDNVLTPLRSERAFFRYYREFVIPHP